MNALHLPRFATRSRLSRHTLVSLAALWLAGAAHAGSVQVTVTGQDGKPAANVVVQVISAKPGPRAPAGAPTLIEQRDLQFSPYLSVVQTGSTVRFTNRDPYDHHVRSLPGGPLGSIAPAKSFELRLGAMERNKAQSADVQLDKAGVVGLGCHLHGSMRGHLLVVDTPYFAKTDAKGVALVDGIPDGAADVAMWHPDQLTEQAPQKVQISATPLRTSASLNFTPKVLRRQAPVEDPMYK
ncbi:MAG: hypothetical protein RLZZ618_2979 [Pseudomonadota bacterium]|jgi:plastocyanin